MFRKLLAMFLGLVFFSGCAASTAPQETPGAKIIGFAQLGEESAWRLANTKSIIESGEKNGFSVIYQNALQKQEAQINAVRSFIAYQVDAIVLAPIVETGWDAVLREAADAGIPVILEDRNVSPDLENLVTAWTGSDFYEEGARAADFIIDKFKDLPQREIRVAELLGTYNSTAAEERHKGFVDTIGSHSRFKVVRSASGDFMISKGREVMRDILRENENIDVLFSHNDDMTLGAIEAIEEAGLTPGKDVVIVTVDAQQKIIDLVRDGKVNCAIECKPYIGDQVFDLVGRVLDGEEVPKKTYSEEVVFMETDDLSAVEERGY